MTWFWILAIVAQSADAGYTCHRLANGARELNPVYGQSCAQVVAVKSAGMASIALFPKSRQKWLLSAAIVNGGVGVGLTIALK